MKKLKFIQSIFKIQFIQFLKMLPLILKYKCLLNLCKFDIHPKKIFSHRFKNLYTTYEVHICRICLKQIVKKVNK
jgi:hypothetical protein